LSASAGLDPLVHDAAGMHLSDDVLTALEGVAAEEEKARSKGAAPDPEEFVIQEGQGTVALHKVLP